MTRPLMSSISTRQDQATAMRSKVRGITLPPFPEHLIDRTPDREMTHAASIRVTGLPKREARALERRAMRSVAVYPTPADEFMGDLV